MHIGMYVSNIMDTIYESDNALIITSLVNTFYFIYNSLCTLTVCEASSNPSKSNSSTVRLAVHVYTPA